MIHKSLLLFAILLPFGSCDTREKNFPQEGKEQRGPVKFLVRSDVKRVVDEQFQRTYNGDFNTQEICFFRAYINSEFTTDELVSFRYFDNCLIFHGTDQSIDFNFSIVGSNDSTDLNFYGLYDIYALKFSEESNNGKIIPFKNDALTQILNRFIKLKEPPRSHRDHVFEPFDTFVRNLYCRAGDEFWAHVSEPIFDWRLSGNEFRSKYRNSENRELFDELFGEIDDGIVSIFEIDYIGAVVFRFIFNADGSFKIEEFVLPSKHRIKTLKNDGTPDYVIPCLVK